MDVEEMVWLGTTWIQLIRGGPAVISCEHDNKYSYCINVDLSYVAEQLLASQEIQCLMKLVTIV